MSFNAGNQLLSSTFQTPSWNALTLLNSWQNVGGGFPNAQWRYHPLLNLIEVIGNIQNGANANGTIIASGLSPAPHAEVNVGLMLDTSGNLLWELGTGVTSLYFHLFFSTDA